MYVVLSINYSSLLILDIRNTGCVNPYKHTSLSISYDHKIYECEEFSFSFR